ncbi:MAG: Cys-tRNA(Pro) deacylase [Erysipelotrichaceae bacterium]|jgi:Cys-tRNA(Pro)/Cys-tRNA(Cys) deacylase|uniref:Cys-tRNA(Pro) deacylase n=1 Tax=Lactimicrobium massiliense TaxID=2161814 RepID=UPI000D55B9D2|nr:Cys-tRNA(Pro) deacylase [Lactimicrobium massiliense]MCH4019352.1 Cys-tRNA(Pro) deacylase [Erysipelotrichaceae bacterium]MCI1326142.1 Cys-tRNA(Pro) deacylase [Solobacterium sp.]MCH4045653.1 Cys-tRNA(Pro) deacylase [Erysipelotrichaceae bacterium]MCH4122862.1 Cys-tRNA(Pro) deacylase [Erysipelotrichaceae bacterium]MCI1363643.1 Cys-tRNA(Pro) deacylase [Solobacterium sp.]
MAKEAKTNAMRMLDSAHVNYVLHTYDTSDGQIDGLAVARKCGEDPEQVFKTLVTQGNDKNFYVFVVPVENELDLKACARSVGVKSVEMIHVRDLLKTTGYIRGGCSPIGMKKKYTTVYDETIVLFDTVLVSGGRIGTQVEIAPSDLIRITDGITADISRS